ncbi:MAG: C45 family autoproteolytic acyltransferase/hydrolase [Planctomycetota bacterium]
MGPTVLLEGGPREMGRAYGGLVAPLLRDRVRRLGERAGARGWTRTRLAERATRFRGFVERIAPEWLDEAEGVAQEAGIEPVELLILNALPPGFWSSESDECTAWLIAGRASATGDTILHKNRDELNEPQDFHVRRVGDDIQVFASRDIGNLGFAHFHSDVALAGGNNTGSPVAESEQRPCGLTCCHLLRLVAERANSCDEAVAVLEEAVAKEVAGGSGGWRGMILMFAEPTRGMVVEMTSRRLASQAVRNGVLVRSNHFRIPAMAEVAAEPADQNNVLRYDRACSVLARGRRAVADCVRLSRDHRHGPDSICSDDAEHFWMTVSACTHVVHGENADPLAHTRASMGNPHNTLSIPVPRAIEGLPAECVSGAFHNLSRALYARCGLGDHLAQAQVEHEAAMAVEFASIRDAVRFRPPATLRPQLTRFVARCVGRVRSLLEGLTG